MTTFLLIRHGAHSLGANILVGRMPDVPLSPPGREQARRMADRVAALPVQAIYSSPLQRTRETAEILAERVNLPVETLDGLAEIDFGDWTGLSLDALEKRETFRRWNDFRSGTSIPRGEAMITTQGRIVSALVELRSRHADGCVALVSHGDVIKSALVYFLGMPMDCIARLEVGLASVSRIELSLSDVRITALNEGVESWP